jgi:acyl dehydratase
MSVSIMRAFEQGPSVAALGRVALSGLRKQRSGPPQLPAGPGPWIEETLPPRSPELIRDYVRHVGGDPGWYKNRLPAHFFHQWGFPIAARALLGLGYPLAKVINGGCRVENRKPLPANEPLHVRVRIESIDDDGKRAIVTQRVVTGTAKAPEAVVADLRAFIPLGKKDESNGASGKKAPKAKPTVPGDVHEIAFLKIKEDAGLDFAKLTGDFNPIHWLKSYARASGFRTVILHGFSTFARSVEALNRARFAGDPMRLKSIDVRLSRPLVLPARVGVYVSKDGGIWVGDAPGGGAYLEGRFETEADRS